MTTLRLSSLIVFAPALVGCAVRAPVSPPVEAASARTAAAVPGPARGDRVQVEAGERFAENTLTETFEDPNRKAKIAAVFPRLDALLAAQLTAQKLPGLAFGVVVDGELVYAKGFGVQDLETRAPVDADTVFRIGSLTKTFTSLAILQLRDQGKLSLDDPARRYLPELAALAYPTRDSAPITIRDLLTHTSGLPRMGTFSYERPDHELTDGDMFGDLPRLALLSAPGTTYAYSNLGVALLGPIVARLSGMRYRDYVNQRIFEPLGMRASFWDQAAVPAGRLASAYAPGPAGLTKVEHWRLGPYEPAGGIYTSLRDLARYAAFQLAAYPPRNDDDAGPLRRSSVREAHAIGRRIGLSVSPHEATNEHPATVSATAQGIGLAWHSCETCELEQVVGHTGATEGFAASIQLLPRRGVAILLLTNHRDANTSAITGPALDILLESRGMAPRTLSASPALTHAMAEVVDLYAGLREERYVEVFDASFRQAVPLAEVVQEVNHLKAIHGTCQNPRFIEAKSAWSGRFLVPCQRGRLEFDDVLVAADGKIAGALVSSHGVPPSPAMMRAATRIAGLVGRWDGPTYAALLAPAFPRPAMQALFSVLGAQHGRCARGPATDGDGELKGSFALSCQRGGNLSLALALDATGARATSMKIGPLSSSPSTSSHTTCPER